MGARKEKSRKKKAWNVLCVITIERTERKIDSSFKKGKKRYIRRTAKDKR